MEFARFLSNFLDELKVTPEYIANQIGVKPKTVKNWLLGKTCPSWSRQAKIRALYKNIKKEGLSIINKIVIV